MKNNIKKMNLNKETAMRIWNKQFGKSVKATDFAGRVIAKGAYDDRNSEFGWNVDHTLPESKGGVTADHNLLCCHILTNDEKADKFPCFTANNQKFEIIKVQNHYEIRKVNKHNTTKNEAILTENGDFFDSAYGIRRFNALKTKTIKVRHVCSVLIKIVGVEEISLINFILDIFSDECLVSNLSKPEHPYHTIKITFLSANTRSKSDIQILLDKCILLNTYLSNYFAYLRYIKSYNIYVKLNDVVDLSSSNQSIYINPEDEIMLNNTIYINDSLKMYIDKGKCYQVNKNENQSIIQLINAGAKIKWHEYNYIFTNLAKNLIKEVNRK